MRPAQWQQHVNGLVIDFLAAEKRVLLDLAWRQRQCCQADTVGVQFEAYFFAIQVILIGNGPAGLEGVPVLAKPDSASQRGVVRSGMDPADAVKSYLIAVHGQDTSLESPGEMVEWGRQWEVIPGL